MLPESTNKTRPLSLMLSYTHMVCMVCSELVPVIACRLTSGAGILSSSSSAYGSSLLSSSEAPSKKNNRLQRWLGPNFSSQLKQRPLSLLSFSLVGLRRLITGGFARGCFARYREGDGKGGNNGFI